VRGSHFPEGGPGKLAGNSGRQARWDHSLLGGGALQRAEPGKERSEDGI